MIELLDMSEHLKMSAMLHNSILKVAGAVVPALLQRKKSSMEKEAKDKRVFRAPGMGGVQHMVKNKVQGLTALTKVPVKGLRNVVDAVDDAISKKACAEELLRLNAIFPCQATALVKSAEVSPERARRAMDRLGDMENTKATPGQVGRYAGIGGGGGAAIAAIGNVIEGYKKPTSPGIKGHLVALGRAAVRADKNPTVGAKIRSIASTGVKGALGAGVIPLARSGTDRSAERRLLKKYIQENANA
jgi:hypothetical protein